MHREYWAGLVNSTVLATKETRTLNLFDLVNDRLVSVYDPEASPSPWQQFQPERGCPWGVIPVDGPFLLRDGWFYSARPFERMAMADGRREALPPPRTDYPFEIKESLQLLDDGKHVLVADQYSIWLLELGPEPARASGGKGDNNSTSSDSAKHPSKSVEPCAASNGGNALRLQSTRLVAAVAELTSLGVATFSL
jgi:hypothetical protein